MSDRLEHINKVLTAQYEALGIIKSVPGVYGVHIVSSLGDPFNYFNYIKTQTPNMRNYYSLSEFENYAKDYCQAHDGCIGSIGGFGDEGCSCCALFEFFMEMKARENPEELEHHTREDGVLLLPTPAATDYKRQKLAPAATDYKRQKLAPAALGRKSPHLVLYAALISAGVIKLSTPTTSQDFKRIRAQIPSERAGTHGTVLPGSLGRAFPSLIGRAIHPQFVEWMMGFPADWTNPDCRLSAMQLCRDASIQSSMPSEELREVSAE